MRLGTNLPGPFSASVNVKDGVSGGWAAIGVVLVGIYLMVKFWYITLSIATIIMVVKWHLKSKRSKQLKPKR